MISKIFVVLWQAIIFMFSAQPAVDSKSVSNGFTKVVLELLFPDMADAQMNVIIESLSFFVRKCAHFAIYFVLGMLMLNCILRVTKFKQKIRWSWLFCILYSISDEIHQLFVYGRSGRIFDVCVDSAGSLCGILLLWLVIGRITHKKQKM